MSRTSTGRRDAQKQRTRQALLDEGLRLLDGQSLSSLGLREVTRAVGVTPAAFYRHFRDTGDLGVALVDEALGSLHALVRAVFAERRDPGERIDRTVELIKEHVRAYPAHVRFIACERNGGVRPVRAAIAAQLERFTREVAGLLAAGPDADAWSDEERHMLAGLFVDQMVLTASAFLSAAQGEGPDAEEVARTARSRLRLIQLGRVHWPG
ncbi:TetR family transcriptional regulator [Streptomyces sp. AJS327]|uniref:TetR family transcriptional regulator n=1 Tax=Streptomyces sp. AJS327 TaxID=2545265 RepID=UPI0015E01B6F|nr:TetR family transcriptional regulator [Streptomyces sp. AJS327]MBA0050613.1 TetR family transcriptional regulator [Streptomyces sp. AJS327]